MPISKVGYEIKLKIIQITCYSYFLFSRKKEKKKELQKYGDMPKSPRNCLSPEHVILLFFIQNSNTLSKWVGFIIKCYLQLRDNMIECRKYASLFSKAAHQFSAKIWNTIDMQTLVIHRQLRKTQSPGCSRNVEYSMSTKTKQWNSRCPVLCIPESPVEQDFLVPSGLRQSVKNVGFKYHLFIYKLATEIKSIFESLIWF